MVKHLESECNKVNGTVSSTQLKYTFLRQVGYVISQNKVLTENKVLF